MAAIKHIRNGDQLLAIIVPHEFDEPGITFLTPDDLSQQLAYMRHPAGKQIAAHGHNPVPREVQYTHEVLVIKRGTLRVDFYDDDATYLCSRILRAGDVILLMAAGHGFAILEETEMFEVKQGPYAGGEDKTVFPTVPAGEIRLDEDA